jgi:hypothetical protein
MTIIMLISALGCFIIAFYCGYWALETADKGSDPQHEFVIRQLTAGAWTFGLLFVASLVAAVFIGRGFL